MNGGGGVLKILYVCTQKYGKTHPPLGRKADHPYVILSICALNELQHIWIFFFTKVKNRDAYIMFPLKFSNVSISQSHASKWNLRMKISRIGLNVMFMNILIIILEFQRLLKTCTLSIALRNINSCVHWELCINIWQIKERCLSADI